MSRTPHDTTPTIPVTHTLLAHAEEQIARLSDLIGVRQRMPDDEANRDIIENHMEALQVWEDAAQEFRDALTGDGRFRAVVQLQRREVGRWWVIRSYDTARFATQKEAAAWGRAQLAHLRARPFPPREQEGLQRIACEVWDVIGCKGEGATREEVLT